MKSTISILMILPFMALFNWQKSPIDPEFEQLWTQVETLEKKAQPRAALDIVDNIIDLAKQKDVPPHWVKGLQYKANFINQLEENGALKAIDFLESSQGDLPTEVLALVQATIAEKLQQYLQNQFYRLSNRTNVEGDLPKDKNSWSAKHFEMAIGDYYQKALSHKRDLLDVETEDYELIVNTGKNTIHLTPTLYDFVAHRAIDYFSSARSYAIEGISEEAIDWAAQLVSFAEFSKNSSTANESKDQLSLFTFNELLLSQQKRDDENAFIYSELKRLEFIRSKLTSSGANAQYELALTSLLKKFPSNEESSLIGNALAQYYISVADVTENKTKAGDLRLKAHEILTTSTEGQKVSYGVQQCRATLKNLERPQLAVQMEKVTAIDQPMLMRISHKGIDGVRMRIGKMSRENYIRYQRDYKYRKNINSVLNDTEIVRNKTIQLVDNANYTAYDSEFIVEELTAGIYLMMLDNENEDIKSFHIVHCSNLGYAHTSVGNEGTKIIVFDRSTGHPLSGVSVSLYSMDYRRNNQSFIPVLTGKTDKDGFYKPEDIAERSYMIELQLGTDNYLPFENIYTGRSYGEANSRMEATILSDRGIYRPGQTIYYKSIVYRRDGKNIPTLSKDYDVTIELVNPNGKVEEQKTLRTNNFGSINGTFLAPEFGLKGQFILRINGMAHQAIRIEEYKRPKFKVELTAPEGELVEGQSVLVPGTAESFAGVALENAKVSYQVVRSKEYQYYWWSNYRFGGRSQGEQLIAVGTLTTDEKGAFDIPFDSKVESEDDKYWRPVYVYKITADVTDENGETRTGTFSLRVGSEPYYLKTDIGQTVASEDFSEFTLSSENAMGQPASANGQLRVLPLRSPSKPTVDRLWDKVDYPVKSENEFSKLFPQFSYNQTSDYEQWEEGKAVYTKKYSIRGDEKIVLGKKLNPGVYKIIALDDDGKEKYKTYFTVYSFEEEVIVTKEKFLAQSDKESYQPGDEMKLILHSPFAGSKTFVQIEKDRQIISETWYDLSNTKIITIPVQEADRGGFVVRVMHVIHGRLSNQQISVKVPWKNKKLHITWETFRDKLLPGQEETWRLNISGPDKEAVMAEVLASMYDASLDEFVPFQWMMDLFPTYYSQGHLSFGGYGLVNGQLQYAPQSTTEPYIHRVFPTWKYLNSQRYGDDRIRMRSSHMKNAEVMMESAAPPGMMNDEMESDASYAKDEAGGAPPTTDTENDQASKKEFAPRTNLNETVFFMPQLMTDKKGNVVIEFTMNEALTAWKLQLLAHTEDLKSGLDTKEIVTQKNLMIFPQIPRFIREGDVVTISSKINKLVDANLSGSAWVEIKDALNGKVITKQLLAEPKKTFSFNSENQLALDWNMKVPVGFIRPIEIIVRAQAGDHTDGEANTIPTLTNQILVTETLPMSVRAGQQRKYTFNALNNMKAKGVRPHRLTLEFMENPVWFAVQSMPYLTDYPHQCTEQIAHKIYANAIASHIIDQYPKIKDIFSEWESKEELVSNLNKNQELKSALIEETPWLRDAESEEEQMKNIALLFDYSRMAGELNKNLDILFSRQLPSGGFAWFSGGRSNVYITQLIVEIFGHLNVLGVDVPRVGEWQSAVNRAMLFSLNEMQERYDRMSASARKDYLDATSLHAIYAISFFTDLSPNLNSVSWKHYYQLAKEKWTERSLYEQALLATAYYRFDEKDITENIVTSFKDRALRSEELGMYWKHNGGYHWSNQPIETHAHIMEAIALVDEKVDDLNEMRIWLLKHKQTNRWQSTVSTAKAIYALLLRGDDWLGNTKPVYVKLGNEVISSPEGGNTTNAQAGTGYFKTSWTADEIKADMANLEVRNPNQIVTWGAAYWQYFQSIDQVEKHNDNPLKIKRSVMKKVRTSQGENLVEIKDDNLSVGDKVTVRLELSVDRMMEFIHLKDLRAAGLEPIDVLSGYQWKGALSYYQSTTDLGTHFFIDYIQAGTYVIEYDAFAVNAGDYSGGMSTLQCMYAPEFASHSEGSRMQIKR